ncbi:hypothetical protein KSP40_PGU017597 [Platanthera guangdongensis]|uniref:Uncharacterized protein n=1 Tax=Platanthera guangdongensis TaxID=2320717 RepID=A0ABR2N0M2_9ASPA
MGEIVSPCWTEKEKRRCCRFLGKVEELLVLNKRRGESCCRRLEELGSPTRGRKRKADVGRPTRGKMGVSLKKGGYQLEREEAATTVGGAGGVDAGLRELARERERRGWPNLEERETNHGHSDVSGGLEKRNLKRQEPTRRQIRQNSILRRKSLEGAGTEWKTGVRRSTRIRMKPLQYWCGERFLYGRVHDSEYLPLVWEQVYHVDMLSSYLDMHNDQLAYVLLGFRTEEACNALTWQRLPLLAAPILLELSAGGKYSGCFSFSSSSSSNCSYIPKIEARSSHGSCCLSSSSLQLMLLAVFLPATLSHLSPQLSALISLVCQSPYTFRFPSSLQFVFILIAFH